MVHPQSNASQVPAECSEWSGLPLQCEPANSALDRRLTICGHANPCATDGTDIRPTPLEAVRLPIFGNPNAQWDGAGLEQDVGDIAGSPAADPDHRDHGGDHPLAVRTILNRVIRRMAAQGRRERLGETRRAERTRELSEVLMNQRRQQRAEAIGLCCDPYSPQRSHHRPASDPADPGHQTLGHCWPARACWVLPRVRRPEPGGEGLPSGIFLVFEDQYGVATWSTSARPSEWSRT